MVKRNGLSKENLEAIINTMKLAEQLDGSVTVTEMEIVFDDSNSKGRLVRTPEGWVYRSIRDTQER